MKISDKVIYRAAQLLVSRRGKSPNDPHAIMDAVPEVKTTVEVLKAIHDAIEEEEAGSDG